MKLKKHFDIIIANPPYGKIGAQITKRILEEVDYNQYINLLPANDYKRVQELWNYVSSMIPVKDGFADAAVTTHIADISKTKVNNWTKEEFEIEQYIDPQLDKYFADNINRSHYALDAMAACGHGVNALLKSNIKWDSKYTFIIRHRDMNHKHLPYSKNTDTYKWNVLNAIDFDTLITSNRTCNGQLMLSECIFKTAEEKQNFVDFIYSDDGFRFMSKIFTAMHIDGCVRSEAFPKVDWTRPWTVEEILRDYKYTEEEIKEVMEDLKNYNGMKD